MPDSPAFKKTVRSLKDIQYTLHVHLVVERHPARPYFWWWTGIHPARHNTLAGGVKLTL